MNHHLDIEIPNLDAHFVNGRWLASKKPIMAPVVSPATEDVLAYAAIPERCHADDAVAGARRAFYEGTWPSLAPEERVQRVRLLCDAIEDSLADLNRAWSFESGATISHGEMLNGEVGKAVWRQMLVDSTTINWSERREDALLLREPVGTVLSIMTFNGPIVLMAMKVIPALLTGCTVIAKHAPESALTARLLAECAAKARLPDGVLSFLPAGTELTQYLVSHQGIDMVSLTGGTSHGIDVVKRTASRLARTTLELGGKSAAIIGEDCDFEEVLESLIPGSSSFMGQICVNLSRILLPKARYDFMLEALASRYDAIQLGDPLDPDTQQGPLSVKRALERVEAYLDSAQREGATVAAGGYRPDCYERGWWFRPTLLSNTDNSMAVAREEIFGPVVVAIPYENIEDAVAIANDSPYGLAASVYMQDESRAFEVAKLLHCGSIAVNSAGISFFQPFGGFKQSGWGKECGIEGLQEFTQVKQVSGL